jgi:hypothetical protein
VVILTVINFLSYLARRFATAVARAEGGWCDWAHEPPSHMQLCLLVTPCTPAQPGNLTGRIVLLLPGTWLGNHSQALLVLLAGRAGCERYCLLLVGLGEHTLYALHSFQQLYCSGTVY